MNGLGNQIVVLDARHYIGRVSALHARAIAGNPRTKYDQLMVVNKSCEIGVNAEIKIYNIDGSEAEACGNGMRCVAKIIGDRTAQMKFRTASGILNVDFIDDLNITVDMGKPKFKWHEIPLRDEFFDTRKIELQAGPINEPILHSPSVCNMGNPHAIFWVEDINNIALEKFGFMLENHPIFPQRANITVAKILRSNHVLTRTWERGVGLTKACGSAACAVLACGVRKKILDRQAQVSVPGGDLRIAWHSNNDGVLMTGPAEQEYQGIFKILPFDSFKIEV